MFMFGYTAGRMGDTGALSLQSGDIVFLIGMTIFCLSFIIGPFLGKCGVHVLLVGISLGGIAGSIGMLMLLIPGCFALGIPLLLCSLFLVYVTVFYFIKTRPKRKKEEIK